MVKIRLQQTGKKNDRKYRIVVADSRTKRDGKTIAVIGYYNPKPDLSEISIDIELADKWIKQGAVMTERVAKLYNLVKSGKVQKPY